jgi:hypothetical protein
MNKNNSAYRKQTLTHLNEIYPIFEKQAYEKLGEDAPEDNIKNYCQELLRTYLISKETISDKQIQDSKEQNAR